MKNILIIDDDPTLLEFLSFILMKQSFKVLTCGSAEDAYPLLKDPKEPIDVILCDYILPKDNGAKFLEKARTKYQFEGPILIISGFSPSPSLLYHLGASSILAKPIQTKDLVEKIDEVLKSNKWDEMPLEKISSDIISLNNKLNLRQDGFFILKEDEIPSFEKLNLMPNSLVEIKGPDYKAIARILWNSQSSHALSKDFGLKLIYLKSNIKGNIGISIS